MRYTFATIFLIFLFGCTNTVQERNLREVNTLTFNIRYHDTIPGLNHWESRREEVAEILKQSKADFIGLQEAEPTQIAYLDMQLHMSYDCVFRTREAKPTEGEATPIFYDKRKWKLINSGTRWLSDTPDSAGSKTYGNFYPRIYTWGAFQMIGSTKMVYVYNTHFDHQSKKARDQSARQIVRAIMEKGHRPVILMGDFNAESGDESINYLTHNGYISFMDAYGKDSTSVTYHGWEPKDEFPGKRIDYIMMSTGSEVIDKKVITAEQGNHPPSDHYPVWVKMRI
ncbi:endonuclease/exonuclease/phosphatase family protein [Limibacter armeniacum]|uniref:endonuclease/exonuclease/phosphatase family protein n=1 Tax=Limibacter armeniacum TaxID=466084 RepID=UPI002FE6BFE4